MSQSRNAASQTCLTVWSRAILTTKHKCHAQLISEDGRVQDFRAGDSFLIPNGFKGYWNVLETTVKHFVIRDYSAG